MGVTMRGCDHARLWGGPRPGLAGALHHHAHYVVAGGGTVYEQAGVRFMSRRGCGLRAGGGAIYEQAGVRLTSWGINEKQGCKCGKQR